jgi:hypothetical protein
MKPKADDFIEQETRFRCTLCGHTYSKLDNVETHIIQEHSKQFSKSENTEQTKLAS